MLVVAFFTSPHSDLVWGNTASALATAMLMISARDRRVLAVNPVFRRASSSQHCLPIPQAAILRPAPPKRARKRCRPPWRTW